MKILITSGGTKIPIDSVRNITNMSTGNFGAKIATEFLKQDHKIVFMKSKGSKSPFSFNIDYYNLSSREINSKIANLIDLKMKYILNYNEYEYNTYDQYAEMLKFIIGVEQPDIILLAAAVSDYGVENYFDGKLRSNDLFNVKLKQLPKLISYIKQWAPNVKLVGFKMLVNSTPRDLIFAATKSLIENDADMVVANDLNDIKNNSHKIQLAHKNYVAEYDTDPKNSDFLAQMVVKHSLLL